MAKGKCINSRYVTAGERREAKKGLFIEEELELQASWTLRRVGHSKVHGRIVDEAVNYASSWWLFRGDFKRIYATNDCDPAWVARNKLAIARIWGGDCALELTAKTLFPLVAWRGRGRPISEQGKATRQGDPNAMWIPDPAIEQIYIPGMRDLHLSVLRQCLTVPFLVRGNTDVFGRSYTPTPSQP